MRLTRRAALSAATATAVLPGFRARAQSKPVIKIGVINDQSGPYRDVNGPTSVICTKQAVWEFNAGGFDVEVLSADNQNKPDVAIAIGCRFHADDVGAEIGEHHAAGRTHDRVGEFKNRQAVQRQHGHRAYSQPAGALNAIQDCSSSFAAAIVMRSP